MSKSLFIILLIILSGCKAKRIAQVYQIPEQPDKTDDPVLISAGPNPDAYKQSVLDTIAQKSLNYSTLSLRAKSAVSLDGKDYDVTLNLRIRKDEAIWVSATALAGIEIARLLITPDSVKLINRLGKEYLKKPFSYMQSLTGSPLSFGTIQALLSGNPPPDFTGKEAILVKNNGQTNLSGLSGQLVFSIIFNSGYKVVQTAIRDDTAAQSLVAIYSNFNAESGQELANTVDIQSTSMSSKLKINMTHSKIVLNAPVEMPFNVPERFTVIN